MDEFRHWWLNEHAQKVLEQQGPMLERYIINIRNEIDGLPGAPQAAGAVAKGRQDREAARRCEARGQAGRRGRGSAQWRGHARGGRATRGPGGAAEGEG